MQLTGENILVHNSRLRFITSGRQRWRNVEQLTLKHRKKQQMQAHVSLAHFLLLVTTGLAMIGVAHIQTERSHLN